MTDESPLSPESFVSASFLKFRQRLIALARSRLASRVRQKVDPEDVVQSVFRSFFRLNTEEEIRPADDDELWNLLAVITARKCIGYGRHFTRQKRDLNREIALAAGGESQEAFQPPGSDPTPSEAAVLTETLEALMQNLDERERTMLTMRLQGYSLEEISDAVGRTERTIRRFLTRIREHLATISASED